ncbi:winged helix-turn-helix transcriptional regulator [Cellulomonas rhizosphaerae]|uniref:Transcriptional regulator n=1 Tax=Cellulomonas rhizosphaerae TaxID=2293719 RepID=A0A413RRL2_9CELL|nr:helix-turn-helix domain-containing protein [Cellulomonas rhizosphaerae]RHA44541.1 transcriptional regulator [Cellulomonas rhizosphaerae]
MTDSLCIVHGESGPMIRSVLDRICDKWTLLIVSTLQRGRMRFTELQRNIPGVSQRMLSLTLRHLERDGLVVRTAYAEVPPRVEYALTDTGATLIEPALALASWAVTNGPTIEASRSSFDSRSS